MVQHIDVFPIRSDRYSHWVAPTVTVATISLMAGRIPKLCWSQNRASRMRKRGVNRRALKVIGVTATPKRDKSPHP